MKVKPTDIQMVKTIGAVKPRNLKFAVGTAILFMLIVFIAMGSWFQVDQGERGVVLRNGKLVRVAEPGLDFKTPFIDNVMTVSVRDHTFVFEKLEAYSYDQQVTLDGGLGLPHGIGDPVVADAWQPVDLGAVPVRRRPVVIRGRAVRRDTVTNVVTAVPKIIALVKAK